MNFKDLGLNDQLLEGLQAMGFESATPIQEQAIPPILDGKDLIACAQTGTGKTAAFILPILHNLKNISSESIDTLILVPTRELAVQIDQQLEGFAYFTGISSCSIYGGRDGASFQLEKKALASGANIVVATPGRLIAHLNLGYVKMGALQHLILDEADRMLDMGFVDDIFKIISHMPKKRQTLMFSATMPPKIRQFAKRILTDPVQISLAVSKPAKGILQAIYQVEDSQKQPLLKHLLSARKGKKERILVFSATKSNVRKLASTLKSSGLDVGEIHSDLDQNQREEVLRRFKSGNLQILVATDILSRGIDVKGIDLVVNYDVPGDAEDYIHRVGRTARADADGVAITLVNRKDGRKFGNIERLMEAKVRQLPLPDFLRKAPSKSTPDHRRSSDSHFHRKKRGRGGFSKSKRR